jgi:hypothetical protein
LYISILVQEAHTPLETEETALEAAKYALGDAGIHLFGLALQIRDERSYHLYDRNNERSECCRSGVIH